MMPALRRGDIVLASLDPSVGTEANKTRPVLIVSNPTLTEVVSRRQRGVLTVVPLTSTIDRIWATEVLIPASESGLNSDSKAQPEQIRAIDVVRVVRAVGRLSHERMAEVDESLRIHLAL